MSEQRRRVMVTGIGLMTAIGQSAAETWHSLLEGRCGIGPLRAYDPAPLRTGIGAEIPSFTPAQWASRRTLRMLCRGDQLALAAPPSPCRMRAWTTGATWATARACSWAATRKCPAWTSSSPSCRPCAPTTAPPTCAGWGRAPPR